MQISELRGRIAQIIDPVAKRYMLVGLAVTIASYLFLAVAVVVLGMPDRSANLATVIFGLILSYIFNRTYAFRYNGKHIANLFRFVVAVTIAYSVNLLVLEGLLRTTSLPSAAAQFLAFSTFTVVAFILHRSWTFAGTTS